jgi:hypothetical protein
VKDIETNIKSAKSTKYEKTQLITANRMFDTLYIGGHHSSFVKARGFRYYFIGRKKEAGAVRLKTRTGEGEKDNRKALLSQAHGYDKGSDTYYDNDLSGANNKASGGGHEAGYSYMVPRHLNVNPNATRIYNVTKDECAIFCAKQNAPPTFSSYTDNISKGIYFPMHHRVCLSVCVSVCQY